MPRPVATDSRAHVDAMIAAALSAADPRVLMPAACAALPGAFGAGPIAALAVGKGASAMMAALPESIRGRVARGLVIVPAAGGFDSGAANIRVMEADHPLPTARSLAAGQAAVELAESSARAAMPMLVLLSGGASALMCVPHAGLDVDDLAAITSALLRSGASIDELNTVRMHCDRIKGGGLAAAAAPAPVHTMILSDVMGDRPELVGSGPTIATATTPAEAMAVLKRRRVLSARAAVTSHLRFSSWHGAGTATAASAPRATHTVIGDNRLAVAAAVAEARRIGFESRGEQPALSGEARDAAFAMVAAARSLRARVEGRACALVCGGETTVTVRDRKGRGGRNLEGALAAAIMIDGDPSLVVATLATDGVDGSSDAAGAVVSGTTASAARRAGADPEEHLARNDSHGFFERAGGAALVRTGPTGTNVNDVWIVLGY